MQSLNESELMSFLEIQELFESKDRSNVPKHIKKLFGFEKMSYLKFFIIPLINLIIVVIICVKKAFTGSNISMLTLLDDSKIRAIIILNLIFIIGLTTLFFIYLFFKTKKQYDIFFKGTLREANIIQIKKLHHHRYQAHEYSEISLIFMDKDDNLVECYDVVRSDVVDIIKRTKQTRTIDVIYAPKISRKRAFIPLKLLSGINKKKSWFS